MIRFRTIALAAVIVSMLASGVARGQQPTAGPFRVVVAQAEDVASWDPPQDWNTAPHWIMSNAYDCLLFRTRSGDNFMPKLAERWERINDLTMRFHLRRNVKFHDGSDFTAEDVRYHYMRIRDGSREQYIVQPQYQFFSDIVIRDRFTIDVVTPGADTLLLDKMSQTACWIVSRNYVERVTPGGVHRRPMGTGPFKLKEAVRGEYIQFEANSDYWGGRPEVSEFVFRIVPEPSTRVAELMTGGVDLTYGLVAQDEARIRSRQNLRAFWAANDRGWMLFPRVKTNERYKGDRNLDRKFTTEDPRVRRAIELAIDKIALRNIVASRGEAYRARLFQPLPEANPALWGDRANLYDWPAASQLLREAGFAPGQAKLTFHAAEAWPSGDIARAIAQMLRRAGFNVDLKIMDLANFNTEIYFPRKNQELILLNLGGNFNPFFGTFSFHTRTALSPSGYGGGRVDIDRLIECGWQDVRNDQRRIGCYHRAQELIADERYVIGLFQTFNLWGANNRLQYAPRVDNYIFGTDITRAR